MAGLPNSYIIKTQFLRHLVHLLFKEECLKIFKVIKQVQKLQKQLGIEKGQNTLKHKLNDIKG